MSQPTFKAPRPVNQIQQEYTKLCAEFGNKSYQVRVLNKDLDLIENTLRDLNAEAFASREAEKKAEQEKAASETPKESTDAQS